MALNGENNCEGLELEDEWETEDENDEKEEIGQAVTKAHKLENPMDSLPLSTSTVTLKNGALGKLEHFKVQQLSSLLMKWVMDLMARNMKQMYRKSVGGWKPRSKRNEMTEENSRYLIAFIDDKPVAFSHFQFDMDYGREVLYCYEIQIEAEARSYGLGRGIMDTLEKLSKQMELPRVVLTVFKFNLPGLAFFKSVGYDVDETSPDEEEKRDYLIMSKLVI